MAEGLTVRPALPRDLGAWDDFVDSEPTSTFCHLLGWREVMSDVLGHECRYLAAEREDGRLHGVLPLVDVRSRLFGNYLVSMPFLNDGGPIGSPEARLRLAEAAGKIASSSGADLLEMRCRVPLNAEGFTRSDRKVAVHLPLPESVDSLWSETFRAKLRSQIRRPIKAGMETRFGAEQLSAFYEVFSRNMRDLGTPVLPRSFFEKVTSTFPQQVIFGVVYRGDAPVAAGCGFIWHGEFEITWASALREFNREAPNMLLYASMMEHLIGRGVRTFNFGRCTPGGSTHKFKLQWGGADVPLPWAQWCCSGVDATPNPDRPVFRLATAAWQRIPVSVANRVGPVLARGLP